jgi:transcriptional regulator with XRE-family HTH domain
LQYGLYRIAKQAISKWESDRGTPDVENLQSIAKLFGNSLFIKASYTL